MYHLPLLQSLLSPRFRLIAFNRMQHDLVRILRSIRRVALTPIVRNCVSKDAAGPVEVCARNGAANVGVSLKTVLRVLVPVAEVSVLYVMAKARTMVKRRTRSGMCRRSQQ